MTLEEVLRLPLGEILRRLDSAEQAPAAPPEEDRLLNVEEAAARLGVTADWLYRQRDLPFTVKVGRLRRYSSAGIAQWIKRRAGR